MDLFSSITAPSLDEWISASSQSAVRRQDITLENTLQQVQEENVGMLCLDGLWWQKYKVF